MLTHNKIVGTLSPLDVLSSTRDDSDQATFDTALVFLDWIKRTGQNAWQMLPLHETELEPDKNIHVPSPYKSYGIGFSPKYLPSRYVAVDPSEDDIAEFINANQDWISDYALFCALRDHFKTDDWRKWDEGARNRHEDSLASYKKELKKEIEGHIVLQWRLERAYQEVRKKGRVAGVELIGDMPFYVCFASPLVWMFQDIFRINPDGSMDFVSGVPDSPAAHFGRQVWGHPLYKWDDDSVKARLLDFWHLRITHLAKLFDVVRLDHAKAFFSYGVVDTKNEEFDRYERGPGAEFFERLVEYSFNHYLSVFAEDAGEKREELRASLAKLNIPGIKIFRFAFNEKQNRIVDEYARIATYPGRTVAYTTTHDTETLVGYLELLNIDQRKQLAEACEVSFLLDNEGFAKEVIRKILFSDAERVIIPIQDWLLLRDRINIPGTEKESGDENWRFRLPTKIENLPDLTF